MGTRSNKDAFFVGVSRNGLSFKKENDARAPYTHKLGFSTRDVGEIFF